jgi:hypothetical protein
MKPMKSLIVLALMIAPAIASAQGYYAGGGPGYHGFHRRAGRLAWGFSVGLGGMHDGGSGVTSCNNCDYNPWTVELDGHIGGMLTNNFALLFELQNNFQTVSANGDVLSQTALMVAGQWWLLPQLWIKGGVGFAHLDFDDTPDIDSGGVIMGAIGYEILSGRFFAMDIQARLIDAAYHGLDDNITSGTIGLGFNWF